MSEVLLNPGSVVRYRNVTWARLPSSFPVFVENVRFISVLKKGAKLDPGCHGVVEEDKYVNCDESSESTGVRSSVTARLVAPTPSAGPCGRAAPAGGRGTTVVTLWRSAAMKAIPGSPVHSSAGTPGGVPVSTPLHHWPWSTRLGALPAPARRLNHRHLFMSRTRRRIDLHLSWKGGLPAS